MQIHPIIQNDLRELHAFVERLDGVMSRLCSSTESVPQYFIETDRWGHQDLPGYLPWMGSRYQFVGHDTPKSIFRGEGIALFLLMRMLRPEIAVECFTGTGYSAAWMAAGNQTTRLYTVDNYSEGGIGEEGCFRSRRLMYDLQLSNVILLYGTAEELHTSLWGRQPGVFFSDGPRVEDINLAPDAVVIRHDNLDGQAVNRSFGIRGGSNLTVMSPSVDERNELMAAMAQYFPVERCGA